VTSGLVATTWGGTGARGGEASAKLADPGTKRCSVAAGDGAVTCPSEAKPLVSAQGMAVIRCPAKPDPTPGEMEMTEPRAAGRLGPTRAGSSFSGVRPATAVRGVRGWRQLPVGAAIVDLLPSFRSIPCAIYALNGFRRNPE